MLAGYASLPTTVQLFIVVVSAATAVATTVQKFIVMKEGREEGRKGSLLGALHPLKIKYEQVETPKYPRPCTFSCNCKIIWASDSGQVGGLPRKFQSYPFGEASKKIMLNFNFPKRCPFKLTIFLIR